MNNPPVDPRISGIELRRWSEIQQTFDVVWRHVGPDWHDVFLQKLQDTNVLESNPPIAVWTLHKILANPQQGLWVYSPEIY